MDIKAYIESGILEEYVSGLLSEEDSNEVDRIAGLYPEVQEEINEIRNSYNLLANRLGVSPDKEILDKALNRIRSEQIDSEASPEAKVEAKAESGSASSQNILLYAVAACVTLLLFSTAINFYFFFELNNTKDRVEELNNELAIVEGATNIKIPLWGLDNSPESHASLYWNTQTSDIYIQVENLPEPPSGHQYQLWAEHDGHMVNIGVFHHNNKVQHIKKFAGTAEAFNVTLEVEGGAEEATVEQAYLRGAI
jgi:hypothetical protein